jgi:hypothetical protein
VQGIVINRPNERLMIILSRVDKLRLMRYKLMALKGSLESNIYRFDGKLEDELERLEHMVQGEIVKLTGQIA